MAGDWIKMRVDLSGDPAVFMIATATRLDEDTVVGKLHRLWSWADKHTTSGFAPGITAKWVDRHVSTKGFADAMVAANWLGFSEAGVQFPKFDRHNGHTAKQRAEGTLRQRASRSERDDKASSAPEAVTIVSQKSVTTVTEMSQEKCDKSVTREEKRREEQESVSSKLSDGPSLGVGEQDDFARRKPEPEPNPEPKPKPGEAKKALAKKPRAEPTGPHADARRDFCARWKAKYHAEDDYGFDFGKHGAMLSWMLEKVGGDAAKLSTIFARFFADDDPFYATDSRHAFDKLRQNFARWQVSPAMVPTRPPKPMARYPTRGERETASIINTINAALNED